MENNNSELNYIAIVGMSGRFPAARNVNEFWDNLIQGKQSSVDLSDEELRQAGVPESLIQNPDFVKMAYPIDDVSQFDASFFHFTPQEAKITDPQQRILLECCYEAFEHAGYASQTYEGLVGVYVGTGPQSYYVRNLLPDTELLETVGPLRLSIGNEKSFASTMVSYKMNLKGPSVNVDTACSTSLVAIHQACQSLLSYECDMALSGGVSLDTPQKLGMHYKEGSIISPDGRCRPFDADAKGTVKGNGAGIVVLKRLSQAIEDGDSIYAVIKGSATNNDGSVKVGYTASSVEGQADVISEAIARADISVDTIRFVEAHGTGTILGDPIEIDALTEVYQEQTQATEFCAVGSVKANVGHLDIAAGVTGLIKSTMALHHRVVPKTINFTRPNPNIDFTNSPFFPNLENLHLDADVDIHAGVSSFGIGGSNVHVVLGNAPKQVSSESARTPQLLVLSAKTQTSLEAQLNATGTYLLNNNDLALADVAHTLQQGRNSYPYRASLVANDGANAAVLLLGQKRKVTIQHCTLNHPQLCFMFPGQGAQHLGMSQGLYQHEAVFRDALNECAALFQQSLEFDLRDCMYGSDDESRLNSTIVSQPVLFATEYATAKLWQSIGLAPDAMVGHSVGEYVAACLAGVFSLQDAIKLISSRARLMQSTAPGAMLMVHLPPQEVNDYLSDECSLAAVNGPHMCVLSATIEHIHHVQKELQEKQIDCRLLPTSHAFHSWMMEPILAEFLSELEKVTFNPPSIPYISNLTGDWIEIDQATDPGYWVKHLRETVQFGKGLETVLSNPETVFLEVGPNQVLSTLARRSFDCQAVVSSARHAKDKSCDLERWLEAVGSLWMHDVSIDWHALHGGVQRLRVGLPTYQFDRQRYWVGRGDMPDMVEAESAVQLATIEKTVKGRDVPKTVQGLLEKLWCDAFGLNEINQSDSFFELGGDSLLATQLISVVKQQLKVDVLLNELFDSSNFGEFVSVVEHKAEGGELTGLDDGIRPIEPDLDNRYEPFPLTDIQQAYWIGRSSSIELGDVATHIYLEVDINNGDVNKFQRSWNSLIQHHDMLRAVFHDSGMQQILADVPGYEFDVIDVSGFAPAEADQARLDLRHKMSHQVLPCDTWPLFDIKAITSSSPKLRLCISIDILIVDAWSMNMLIEQWLQLYRNEESVLRPLAFSFRDYVIAEHNLRHTELYQKSEEYWFSRIDSLPSAPTLPIAKDPSEITDVKFERRVYEMEAERWGVLKSKARTLGVTPTCLLISAFSEVLSLWCQDQHFTLNLTNYSRHPFHEDAEFIVGDFTSLTLLEVCSRRKQSFAENADAIQKQLWRDLDNRFVSAIHVLREMGKQRNGRVSMPIVFTSTLGGRALEHEDSADDLGEEVFGVSQTSQVWLDHQVMEWQGKLKFNWDVVEELFPAGMIQSMFDVYCQYIERLVDDAELWHNSELDHLLPAQDRQLIDASNRTQSNDQAELLHQSFLHMAQRKPDNVAIYDGDLSLTYGQLYAYSQLIGQQLRALSVQPNDIVGIHLDKGWQQIAAVMGILVSGAAYLPIDVSLPLARRQFIIDNSQAKALLVCDAFSASESFATPIAQLNVDALSADELSQAEHAPLLNPAQTAQDAAYVLYTSGSTGAPKGAILPHRGPRNTVRDMNRTVKMAESDRVIALSALHFDLSVYDVFGPLSEGAALVMVPPNAELDPAQWDELIQRHHISLWNSVPALVQIYIDYLTAERHSGESERSLRTVVMSGDWIPPKLPARIFDLWPTTQVLGAGGPTECSIWDACHWVTRDDTHKDSIPYGYPMANHQIHILNGQLQTCPVGVTGEMYIAGDGVFSGYLGDPEKTDAVLITHPETGQPLYKSGDLGRYTGLDEDGIEILGRADFQVKINGYRIELGEIETAIRDESGYDDVVVIAQNSEGRQGKGANRLVAYIASDQVASNRAGSGSTHNDGKDAQTQAKLVEFKLSKPGIRKSRASEVVHLLPEIPLVENAYKARKSYRFYFGDGLTLTNFSGMLSSLAELRSPELSMPKYRYASAGSLHPVQVFIYVKAGAIEGLGQGFYYYQPEHHHLVRLECSEELTRKYWGNGDNLDIFDRSGFSLFLVGELDAVEPVYGQEGAREMMYLEAGYMSQLLQEVSPKENIGLCPMGYVDDAVASMLDLTESQTILHCMVGGSITQEQVQSWTGITSDQGQDDGLNMPAQNDHHALNSALASRLPSYMLPAAYVVLDQLPLTANGKVDRKLLAAQEVSDASQAPKVAPSNRREETLLTIWQEVLGRDDISTQDNFFEIGGDSVLILKVFQRLRDTFDVQISVVDLFQYPKIQELAEYLDGIDGNETLAPTANMAKVSKQKAAIRRQRKHANRRSS